MNAKEICIFRQPPTMKAEMDKLTTIESALKQRAEAAEAGVTKLTTKVKELGEEKRKRDQDDDYLNDYKKALGQEHQHYILWMNRWEEVGRERDELAAQNKFLKGLIETSEKVVVKLIEENKELAAQVAAVMEFADPGPRPIWHCNLCRAAKTISTELCPLANPLKAAKELLEGLVKAKDQAIRFRDGMVKSQGKRIKLCDENARLRELVKDAYGIMASRGYAQDWVKKAQAALTGGKDG